MNKLQRTNIVARLYRRDKFLLAILALDLLIVVWAIVEGFYYRFIYL